MSYLDVIPKTLPKENPLLFSFLMILDALKTNIRFNGKYERNLDKVNILPAFEYAINSWSTIGQLDGTTPNGQYTMQLDVIAAIWKEQPLGSDNAVCWSEFPNGDALNERSIDVSYTYDFESWRTETAAELQSIIAALVYKGAARDINNNKNIYLTDIFGWKLLNNTIQYVYAKNQTANQLHGVGARFTLQGNYYDCCPKAEDSLLTKAYFEGKGFDFTV